MRTRTNIYLDEGQLRLLRLLASSRGESVAAIVRDAIDEWLAAHGVREVPEETWQHRLGEFLERQRAFARDQGWNVDDVERDVREAIAEVRAERARRR